MDIFKTFLSSKRNLIGIIIAVVLLVALPVGLYLVRTQQIFKPKAAEPGTFILSASPNQITVPSSVHYTANAQLTGFDNNGEPTSSVIGSIQIKTVKVDSEVSRNILEGPFSFAINTQCGFQSSCSYQANDQYNDGDEGLWEIYMNVYDENGDLYCSGDPQAEGTAYDCGGNSFAFVNAQSSGGGGGNTGGSLLHLQAGNNFNCVNNLSQVSLDWDPITNATRYSVTRDGYALNTNVTLTQFIDTTATPSTPHVYTVAPFDNATALPVSDSEQITVQVPACSSSGGGGTGGSGTINGLTVAATNVACNTSNQRQVFVQWSTVSGASVYSVTRSDNQGASPIQNLGNGTYGVYNDITSGSTYTYTVVAYSGASEVARGTTQSITGSCVGSGGGPGGGGPYFVCGANRTCTSTSTTTANSYGTLAGCQAACGGGGGGGNNYCNATPQCNGACNVIGTNTCNNGNGFQTDCNFTTLNGSTGCTPTTAPNQTCNAGDHCDPGNTCNNGSCVPNGVNPPPPAPPPPGPPPPPPPPSGGTPVSVKLANGPFCAAGNACGLSPDAYTQACTNVLSSSNDIRPLNGQLTLDVPYTLDNANAGTKTVCAVFLDANNNPVGNVFWNTIQLTNNPGVSPTPSPTGGSCTTSNGDANKDGRVTLADYVIWSDEALQFGAQVLTDKNQPANFNCDDKVDNNDFVIWRNTYLSLHP